jgi:transposase
LTALGHQVRLVPPSYVKAYLKRGKNDAADAEAICEAVTRPNMRFVPVKSEEQQGVLVVHRGRELLVRQRTMLVNGLRAHMAEFGIIVPQGIQRLPELVAMRVRDDLRTYDRAAICHSPICHSPLTPSACNAIFVVTWRGGVALVVGP